jgi:hypothetical protein
MPRLPSHLHHEVSPDWAVTISFNKARVKHVIDLRVIYSDRHRHIWTQIFDMWSPDHGQPVPVLTRDHSIRRLENS